MDSKNIIAFLNTFCNNEQQNILITNDKSFSSSRDDDTINVLFELPKSKHNFSLRFIIKQNKININGNNPLGHHILRLLNIILFNNKLDNCIDIENNEANMCDIILKINDIFTEKISFYDNCTFCNKNITGMKIISCCSDRMCQEKYYRNVTDNCVTDMYNTDKLVLKFLIMIIINGCLHPKADESFKPLPCIKNIKTASEFKKIIPPELQNTNLDNIFNILSLTSNDIMFKNTVGETTYAIIKNAINGNNFMLSSYKENVIKILYPADVEAKFKNKKHVLFHGSGIFSWYPIIKNGLKNMSGTKLQLNGAVHGSGMYFSDSPNFALGYSRNYTNCGYKVIGIFDIIDDIKKYYKTTNIFVIPNVEIVLLRYLVIVDNNSMDVSMIEELTKNINQPDTQNETNNNLQFSVKRLEKEIKKIKKNKLIKSVKINNDDVISWDVDFNNGMKIKINFIEYPLIPPDIYIHEFGDYDKSQLSITSNNKLQMPILEPKNWSMSVTINDIINKFIL